MGADSLAKNTPTFIRQICPIGPKVWYIIEIRLHWASVVRVCKRCLQALDEQYSKMQGEEGVKNRMMRFMKKKPKRKNPGEKPFTFDSTAYDRVTPRLLPYQH